MYIHKNIHKYITHTVHTDSNHTYSAVPGAKKPQTSNLTMIPTHVRARHAYTHTYTPSLTLTLTPIRYNAVTTTRS